MGFLDEIKKLTHPYEDDDEYMDDEVEEVEAPAPKKSNPFSSFASPAEPAAPSQPAPAAKPKRDGRVVSFNNSNSASQMRVIIVKPERFEVVGDIADHLRNKHAVVLNLETTPKDITRRVIDFVSGAAYALDGKVKKIANNTYILTPYNVDLSGFDADDFDTGANFF